MIITNLTLNNYHKNNHQGKISVNKNLSYSHNFSFGNNISLPQNNINRLIESCLGKLAILQRKLKNRIRMKEQSQNINTFYQKVINIDENSPEYIKYLHGYAKSFARGKEVEINLESRRILDIVNSDDSCIFIVNHDAPKKDPAMLGIFNTLLNGAYIVAGKASTCPRPKIIINEDILSTLDVKQKAILEKFGAVGIDASLFNANSPNNAKKLLPIMKAFLKDQAHIFIFPEGKMIMFKDLDLEYKFQTGVGEIINKLTTAKKSVKVVPLAFAYNNESKQFLGSIHVGEPVFFKKQGANVIFSEGNMDSSFASQKYVDFFKDAEDGFRTITEKGHPVIGKDLPDYIAGVLCENLRICKEEAKRQLPIKSLGDKVIKFN